MLHDLLLALMGHGGDIFVEKENFKFEIANDLGFFHPSEIVIIHDLLHIGSQYKKIMKFCDTYGTVQIAKEEGYRGGLYLSSLSVALRETAEVFCNTVVELEDKLLNDPQLPLSQLLLAIQPQAPLLSTFSSLVTEIEDKKVHGCMILEVLHKHTANSVAHIKQILMRVEQTVHLVLYDQLTHWLLYGLLLDPHQELFIHTTSEENIPEMQDAHQTDALVIEEMEDFVQKEEWKLKLEMLPSHIPLHVAEKILFIGESILILFERDGKTENGMMDSSSKLSQSCLMVKNKEKEFLGLIEGLSHSPTFSILDFSNVIENIRHFVSQQLWKLVLEAGLVAELEDLKAVFLLGRGELYQTLIPTLTPYFCNNKLDSKHNVDRLFQLAGRQVLLEDGMLEKFTLSVKSQSSSHESEAGDVLDKSWKTLKLEYHAKWPLHKLVTPAVQEKYNNIFIFLLDVRRAQYRLQHLWITQMATKCQSSSKADSLQWTLRHHMNLLIDNIQYYLQVDVLESQHWQLIEEISKTNDYQHLARAHHNFLVSLSTLCFLNNSLVNNSLQCILQLVHQFCKVLEKKFQLGARNPPSHAQVPSTQQALQSEEEQMKVMSEQFERAAAHFFLLLSNLRLRQGLQHTSQLIMRIDYNKYYSNNETVKRFRSPLHAD